MVGAASGSTAAVSLLISTPLAATKPKGAVLSEPQPLLQRHPDVSRARGTIENRNYLRIIIGTRQIGTRNLADACRNRLIPKLGQTVRLPCQICWNRTGRPLFKAARQRAAYTAEGL